MRKINKLRLGILRLFLWIFFWVIILFTYSCGSRKVNKKHSKEQTQTETKDNSVTEKQSDTNIKTMTTVKVDDKNETIIEETITEPLDASKESFLIEKDGSKLILGNIKKTVRKTTKKNNTKSELVRNIDEFKKEVVLNQQQINNKVLSNKENSLKAIDKKQFNPFELLWLVIPMLIIWYTYRKYKNLPLVPKF